MYTTPRRHHELELKTTDQRMGQEYTQAGPVYELIEGSWKGFVLKTAVELNVFDALADGPCDVERLAAAKHWDVRGTRLLLDALCPLGLLSRNDEGEYGLTEVAEAFLAPGSETYAGDYVLTALGTSTWEQLAEVVRAGQGGTSGVGSPAWSAAWAQDAAMESVSTWRIDDSREMWRTLGIAAVSQEPRRILDVASGCGIKSFVLAKDNPNARITCLDQPAVLKVAEQLVVRWDIAGQAELRPGDVTALDYGDSEFDVVLLGQITFYWSADQIRAVLSNVHRALKSGGRVVIHAHIGDQTWQNADAALLGVATLLFSEKGDIHSFAEYEGMLSAAGFAQITHHNDRLVSATKPTKPTRHQDLPSLRYHGLGSRRQGLPSQRRRRSPD